LMLYTSMSGDAMMCGPGLWPPQPVTDPLLLDMLYGRYKPQRVTDPVVLNLLSGSGKTT